jgi:hypothetical protein
VRREQLGDGLVKQIPVFSRVVWRIESEQVQYPRNTFHMLHELRLALRSFGVRRYQVNPGRFSHLDSVDSGFEGNNLKAQAALKALH